MYSFCSTTKAKLVQSGDVTVTINSERKIVSQAGSSLLNVMAEDKVFLPSACGGQGNCGMCKCQVEEGGGEILPTEVGFFNRKQIKENYRLACQVKVKNDMEVKKECTKNSFLMLQSSWSWIL